MLNSKTKDTEAQQILNDPRWQKVLAIDAQADGQFYYQSKPRVLIADHHVALARQDLKISSFT